MESSKIKNIIILLTEISVVFLMALDILPRDMALVITGIMVFYFIFSPLEDSLWVFIASIPLFIALPIADNFDSMANWRILLAGLFLVWLVKNIKNIGPSAFWQKTKEMLRERLISLVVVFLVIGIVSLFFAVDVSAGIKKLLFLINAFFLYIIVRDLIGQNKEFLCKVISAFKTAIGMVLVVGFFQLAAVFFIPLHTFWQFWAKNVISVFYGQNLADLLLFSNTWFSYYTYLPPSLRMFSVFPDSHSFAFFIILSLPFLLTPIFVRERENIFKIIASYSFLILALLAVIFSGSRGAWISALGAGVVFLSFVFLYYSSAVRNLTNFFLHWAKNWWRQIWLIFGVLIIFFLLFPLSSGVLLLSQKAQMDDLDMGKLSLFERAKSITDFSELSAKTRFQIWDRTLASVADNPFLGIGIGNYPVVLNEDISAAKKGSSAHNLYLDIAAEMGVFALIVLLFAFWQIFKEGWLIFTREKDSFCQAWAGFFVLALIWVLAYSLFDVVLLNDKVLLFFLANVGLLSAIQHSDVT